MTRLGFAGAVGAVLCATAQVAKADVVAPPPEECPPFSIPRSSHSGPLCYPPPCSTEDDPDRCRENEVCEEHRLCVEDLPCGGYASPEGCTVPNATSECGADGACDVGTCQALRVCVSGTATGGASTGGAKTGGAQSGGAATGGSTTGGTNAAGSGRGGTETGGDTSDGGTAVHTSGGSPGTGGSAPAGTTGDSGTGGSGRSGAGSDEDSDCGCRAVGDSGPSPLGVLMLFGLSWHGIRSRMRATARLGTGAQTGDDTPTCPACDQPTQN